MNYQFCFVVICHTPHPHPLTSCSRSEVDQFSVTVQLIPLIPIRAQFSFRTGCAQFPTIFTKSQVKIQVLAKIYRLLVAIGLYSRIYWASSMPYCFSMLGQYIGTFLFRFGDCHPWKTPFNISAIPIGYCLAIGYPVPSNAFRHCISTPMLSFMFLRCF